MHALPNVRSLCFALALFAAVTLPAQQRSSIDRPVDRTQVVTLTGNTHPLARAEFDEGPAAPETRLDRMILELKPSPRRQAQLDALTAAQHDPASQHFHHWLTPAEYAARFGASDADLARVAAWLRSRGFAIDEVAASRRLIQFSGTAAQVADAFHTELHRYRVHGEEHIANAQDPQIPAALAGVIDGIVSLHDFRRNSQISSRQLVSNSAVYATDSHSDFTHPDPAYTSGSTHYLFPADWATIYDLNSLYSAGTSGGGAAIAIVGRSNITLSDVSAFRGTSGLPANQPTVILVSTNPGLVSGDQDESTLDVEWAGATAPAATVKFVVGKSTTTTDGIDLAAQYIVNHATATVMSTSYGSCEQDMGTTELSFYNALWQQAASEGISALVSSGDSGAAGCDAGSATRGAIAAVNGLCSSTYSTCVGGTEFNEGASSAYWATSNSSSDGSAFGYIPEKVWNESASDGGSNLWASGGGISTVYAQPTWQKGVAGASLSNGMRTVPDVAVTAASHDGYIIVENGSEYVISGTSAASPSLAGVLALVVQSQGGKGQGNANTTLYSLLNASKDPFHATPSGNNTVPGVSGFTANGADYNLATGLGSVDGALLVNAWPGAATITASTFTLSEATASGTVQAGKSVTFTVSVTETSAARSAVTLSVKAPAGVTASISPASITPGTTATVTLSALATAAAGTDSIVITGVGGAETQSLTFALTVAPNTPTLALTAASGSVTVAPGKSVMDQLTLTGNSAYSGTVSLSVSGLPAGVTAAFSTSTVSLSSGAGNSTLTLTATTKAAPASATVTVTARGDGLTATRQITVQVTAAAGLQLTISAGSLIMAHAGSGSVTVTLAQLGGLDIPTTLTLSGLPPGVTPSLTNVKVGAAGTITATLTFTGSAAAKAGASALIVGVTGFSNGTPYTASQSLKLQLN